MAYHADSGYGDDFVMGGEGHGEEELVVFASVEGCGDEVHVELFGHGRGLVVDGYAVFVDAAAGVALVADVQELGGEPVRYVHHGGGEDVVPGEFCDDVFAGFGLELAFEEVFASFECGLEVFVACEYFFFSFEELQPHVGGSEISAYAYEVVFFGSVAVDDFACVAFADAGDADGEPSEGGGCVASDKVYSVYVAGELEAGVEFFEVFDGEALGYAQRQGELLGLPVHGVYV